MRRIKQHVTPKRKSLWRRIFTPQLLFFCSVLILICIAIFVYYYVVFSEMIDAKLQGNIFVRTTGIYTAPLRLRPGMAYTKASLVAHCQNLGYLSDRRDQTRGYFTVTGNKMELEPSSAAIIDGNKFPKLRITFSADGKRIVAIEDLDEKKALTEAFIEPELLTSINKEKEKRKIISFSELPKHLVDAIIAIEDRRFFDHPGIDFRGLFRALWRNVEEGRTHQGGSTITQQLVKNFFLTPERTLKRKLSEAFISILLETRLTKEQIFEMYCNEIHLGQDGSYSINGVGEAADFYFRKDVSALTLSEAAFLAGIIHGPSYYSPYTQPKRAIERRNQVLTAMVEAGKLSQQEADIVSKSDLKVVPKSASSNAEAPYFLDYLQAQLAEYLGKEVSQDSYRIYSTIDMQLQRAAEQAVRDGLAQLEKEYKRYPSGSLQAALVALNANSGEILAMVGGRDYAQSQLNRAVEARRQPGSVFKPIVYAAALQTAYEETDDNIITAASQFLDAKETFIYGNDQTYEPDNYGENYSNQLVTIREALTQSLNVVAVRVAEKAGYARVAKVAEQFGLPKPQPLPSIALGVTEATPLQIAAAYTAFANLGTRYEPYPIARITDAEGRTLFQHLPYHSRATSPQIAFIITSILQDVINKGTAARARSLGFTATAAGKTGTSRDGWFAGFTPNLVCVVYVGFDDNSQLGLEGSKAALPIWTQFMKQALAKRPDLGGDSFPKPKTGITTVTLDRTTRLVATPSCSEDTYEEHFISGTEPTQTCDSILNEQEGEEEFSPIANTTEPDRPRRPRRILEQFLER